MDKTSRTPGVITYENKTLKTPKVKNIYFKKQVVYRKKITQNDLMLVNLTCKISFN